MKNKLHNILTTLVVAGLLFIANNLFAQPGPPMGQSPPPCWPPPCIPIDGGIGFLVAAGIAFGVKKTMDMKNRKNN